MLRISRPRLAIATLALTSLLLPLAAKPARAICPHFFCYVDSDCAMFCPSQPGRCINNVCQYF